MATKKKAIQRKPRARVPAGDPIENELKALQLEELRMSLASKKANAEMAKIRQQSRERALASQRADVRRLQKMCNHRKGGKDKQGIGNGSDSDYSVVKHTYPDMSPSVMCMRCQMDWRKGTTKTKLHTGEPNHTGISFEEAMNWPTDNEPSAATFFLIPSNDAALVAQIASLQEQIRQFQAQGINISA